MWNQPVVQPIFDAAALALLWVVFSLWFRRHDEICESYQCPFSMGQIGRFIPIYIRPLMPDKSNMPPKFEAESIVFWSLQTNKPANQLRSSLLQLVYTCFGVLTLYWDCIEYFFYKTSKWSTSWSGWPFAESRPRRPWSNGTTGPRPHTWQGQAQSRNLFKGRHALLKQGNKVIWFSWLGSALFCVDLQCIVGLGTSYICR